LSGRHFLSGRAFLSGAVFFVGILVPALALASQSAAPSSAVSKPYRSLFQPKGVEQFARVQRSAPPPTDKPRVVCGMTIIPVDPKTDPKMVLEPRTDSTRYTIRAIEPSVCWQR
jgi:hypothetical protein